MMMMMMMVIIIIIIIIIIIDFVALKSFKFTAKSTVRKLPAFHLNV